ncbi:hypothetical protein JMK10_19360 [Rhodovulum sulfidophilum]|uniref:hypothetical protein n=1 Tax=Rhodovulum sulfidophilum TaxID=35806 RepID=UPI0019242B7A|nr:hypothetical protein [Rhodovulum sulfidophilum]MBL3576379.1 hypothetical protein [Rhodovulum sulfidophilum]MCE8433815.1 hypothetical protein [Rhodovulum sulfidophilum]MCF4118886.1 hypothetical protein [Rhodovulum sulfidophilum]
MRKKKKRSDERKHFEGLLEDRYWEVLDGRDPVKHWDLSEENQSDNIIRHYGRNWSEAEALVATLEDTHLDESYSPDKRYSVEHYMDIITRNTRLRDNSGDPNEIVRSEQTRAEILARLSELAHLDFGDDPDEWRRWFKAFDEDDFFPPVR